MLTGDGGYINVRTPFSSLYCLQFMGLTLLLQWAFTEANIASNVVDDERKTHTIVFRQPEILPAC